MLDPYPFLDKGSNIWVLTNRLLICGELISKILPFFVLRRLWIFLWELYLVLILFDHLILYHNLMVFEYFFIWPWSTKKEHPIIEEGDRNSYSFNIKKTILSDHNSCRFVSNIKKSNSLKFLNPYRFMYMPKYMIFWLYFKNSLFEILRTWMFLFFILVQYSIGRTMCNKNINISRNNVPNNLFTIQSILEGITDKIRCIGWSKYLDSFDLYHLMFQVDAPLL